MSNIPQSKDDAIVGAVVIATAFVVMTLATYAIDAAIGYNPIHLPFEKQVYMQGLLPQGWKFFTRNPREDVQFIFKRDENRSWKPVTYGVNSLPSNAFGINRRNRAQGVEIGRLLQSVPKAFWVPAQGDPLESLEMSEILTTVRNETPHPTICGTIGIVLQPALPWAWFATGTKAQMPSKVLKIEVRCF
jgi:antimicrobial peptide system SdpA family protein